MIEHIKLTKEPCWEGSLMNEYVRLKKAQGDCSVVAFMRTVVWTWLILTLRMPVHTLN